MTEEMKILIAPEVIDLRLMFEKKDKELENKDKALASRDKELADNKKALASKGAEIERWKRQLQEAQQQKWLNKLKK